MKIEIYYEDDYAVLCKVNNYLKLTWKKETAQMDDDEYKNIVLKYAESFKHFQLSKIQVDTRQFLYAIIPEIQDWINSVIVPKTIENGLRRMAIMTSPDFYAQLSVEQTMEDKSAGGFIFLFFEDDEKALKWLLEE